MPFFPHPVGLLAGGGPPEIAFIAATEDPANLTTYSFAGQSIGAADDTRRVVVAVHWHSTVSSRVLNSATIAGIAATIHQQGTAATGNCAIISALVPTGTTATIAFTLDGGVDHAAIAVYRAINETVATHHAVMVDNAIAAGVFTGTIDIPVDGWVVAACQPNAGATTNQAAWAGVTERYDLAYTDALAVFRSGGSDSLLALQTGRTVSCTITNGTLPNNGRMVAMSWG